MRLQKILFFLLVAALSSCHNTPPPYIFDPATLSVHPDLREHLDHEKAPFYHGVASGDPTQEAVIIWTKLTLDSSVNAVEVHWEMSADPSFGSTVQSGQVTTDALRFHTVKVDVKGLQENTRYFYRFRYMDRWSDLGESKTLPANPDSFDLAFVACSNYEFGYFHNYRFIANDSTVDLVLHLGDYIYEYAVGVYGDTAYHRLHVPAGEVISLDDYRTRYSQYRLDPDLQLAHQKKPFVQIWDDHELANNAYVEGAQNHQEDEGSWESRKRAIQKAYYEWMPVREQASKQLYRSFRLGDLLELSVLDTRLAGRTKQVDSMSAPNYRDSNRTILGQVQKDWLKQQLKHDVTWKIIGNQVPFGPLYFPMDEKGDRYMDGWDGYPTERTELVEFMRDTPIDNVVFLTGDFHRAVAFENDLDGTLDTEDNVSVEFVVTSITSSNDDEWRGKDTAILFKERYLDYNQHMKYINNEDHGYGVLRIAPEAVQADYYFTSTLSKGAATKRKEQSIQVRSGESKLVLLED